MNVEVIIEVFIPPEKEDLDSLKRAASRLTNNQKSITVRTAGDSLSPSGWLRQQRRISLITDFTMRTTAQYKVVDDISREFEFQTFALKGYQDMTISFPKKARGIVDE
jgi:hypothetical protein